MYVALCYSRQYLSIFLINIFLNVFVFRHQNLFPKKIERKKFIETCKVSFPFSILASLFPLISVFSAAHGRAKEKPATNQSPILVGVFPQLQERFSFQFDLRSGFGKETLWSNRTVCAHIMIIIVCSKILEFSQ